MSKDGASCLTPTLFELHLILQVQESTIVKVLVSVEHTVLHVNWVVLAISDRE